MEVVIKKGRKIEIPESAMRKLGLEVGKKVIIREKADSLEIVPAKIKAVDRRSMVDEISGKLKLKQEIIDELVESEDVYAPEGF